MKNKYYKRLNFRYIYFKPFFIENKLLKSNNSCVLLE